jgi:hypothetical protein
MAELKTNRNKGDVDAFLKSVPDEKQRRDSFTILELMKQVTGSGYLPRKSTKNPLF